MWQAPGWDDAGVCKHVETVPVTLLMTGEEVAQICLGCDAQLPPGDLTLFRMAETADAMIKAISSEGFMAPR